MPLLHLIDNAFVEFMDNGIRNLNEETVYPVRIRQNALHCSVLEFCRHTIPFRRPGLAGARPSPREISSVSGTGGTQSLHPHPTRSQQVATLPFKDPARGPERNVPAPPSARGAEKKTRRNSKPVGFRLGTFRREIFIKELSSHLSAHLRRGARFSPLYSRLGSFGVGLKKLSRKYRIRSIANMP